ncbi:MAG TPA: methionyl-tRNA formyltransferase [Tepidisphaeraceae bacterium]|nr:methionyl-tRNA formyltransferase [Tepidisphaeraceae bacterium]
MAEPDGLRVIFAGAGEFGLPTLRALLQSGHEMVRVVTQPDRPAGRGRGMTPTPIGKFADEAGIGALRTADINSESLPPADVMVVIAFGQKIAPAKVDHPRLGSINLHASRLPRYRGAAPINWAIINGDPIAGNSAIRLAQRMDAGSILAQSSIPIGELETAGELHDRLSEDGVALVLGTLDQLASGTATELPQDDSLATIAPKLSRESARLDFSRPADELARRIRGLYPWPGCRVKICDAEGTELSRLRLVRARARARGDDNRWTPGEITSAGLIETGQGSLELVEIQPDGGRLMSIEAYRRGHRWQAGLHLKALD